MGYIVQSYIVIFIETICCIIFCEIFGSNTELKRKNVWLSRWRIIFYLSVTTCVTVIALEKHMVAKQVSIIILSASFIYFYRNWELKKCIVLSIAFQSLSLIADFITILVKKSLLANEIRESDLENFIIIAISKLILFLIILFISKMSCRSNVLHIKENEWVIFFGMSFFSILILLAIAKNAEFVTNQKLEQLFWILAIGLVWMNITMFYFIQNLGKRGYLLKEKALLEADKKNQLHLYETIQNQMQEQRKISHEYKNQLMCIQALCVTKKYDELIKYLEQISEAVLHDLDYIDTNHVLANAVLNVKYQEAMKNNILFICKINDLSGLTIDSTELVVLLSNLLNNAIEACKKCSGIRKLTLKCVYEQGDFILSVKNSYDGTLKLVGGTLYTTKKSNWEGHGIGLKNVIKIVEKNKGNYAMDYTDTEFNISIVIPQGHIW